jgi:phosphoribosylanthranilate isomerase
VNVRVKICGLRDAESMVHAIQSGADYVGLVFTESPRRVNPDEVATWLDDARNGAEVVGVFRDQPRGQVGDIIEQLDLDFVQLHGGESGEEWHDLPIRLIEAGVVDEAPPALRFPGRSWAHLLDSGAGSGITFSWTMAAPVARAQRVFLAGGLKPENVAEAIRIAMPFAVDVSTGVESSPGVKDAEAVAAFVAAAKGVGSS